MEAYGMKYEVDDRLKSVVQPLYSIRAPESAATEVFHLSPNLEMLLIFSFGTPLKYSFGHTDTPELQMDGITILGPLRQLLTYERAGGSDILVLPFVLDGFYRVLGISPDNLDLSNPDDPRLVHTATWLEEMYGRLSEMPDPILRAGMAEAMLLEAIAPPDTQSIPLLQSLDVIQDAAVNPVKVIAEQWGISERVIQHRFRKYGGYSPKELIRFLRFKEVVNWLLANPSGKPDWFFLIEKFGFHDQSHLIKDFKQYTGAPPKAFLRMNSNGSFCTSWETGDGDQ